MLDRVDELREKSYAAERAVAEFKQKNNIVETGGRLLDEQQLSEMNTAMTNARLATSEAEARLERVSRIIDASFDPANKETATIADTLHNEVIVKFRRDRSGSR